MGRIFKQPNGLYCRYSTVSESITEVNMTADEYIALYKERAAARAAVEAKEILDRYIGSYEELLENLLHSNNQEANIKYIKILKEQEVRLNEEDKKEKGI